MPTISKAEEFRVPMNLDNPSKLLKLFVTIANVLFLTYRKHQYQNAERLVVSQQFSKFYSVLVFKIEIEEGMHFCLGRINFQRPKPRVERVFDVIY